ncbi:MAG: asparagine synthetase B family protein [Leptolyngbyaceae cyanobacterium MO_188.B28]|nr:asparagine synthetase B family protein [Leptolyngbyaceae cyanobacterium MO_188.B28]
MAVDGQPEAQPWGFIGYWGQSPQSLMGRRLRDAIAHLSSSSRLRLRESSSASQGVAWGVVQIYNGSSTARESSHRQAQSQSTNGECLGTLSASGLGSTDEDIWVRVKQDGSLEWGRTPFGRAPLYWMQQGSALWFASQLRYLLPLVELWDISLPAFYGYTCFSYVPTPLTPIQAIQAVPAGVTQQHRWSPQGELLTQSHLQKTVSDWSTSSHQLEDEAAAVDQLQTLLKAAVSRQLNALPKGPVGVFLSGGLDSSVVAALLTQAGVEVQAYSLDFGHEAATELPYARQTAEFLGIPLVTVKAEPTQIRAALAATAQALDLPFGDSVTVPLYLLNQSAAADTTVVFNGENGDQLFAGWTNKPLITARLYNLMSPEQPEAFDQQYLKTFHRFYGYETQIFTPPIQDEIAALSPHQWLQSALGSDQDPLLHRLRRATLMLKGAQNIQPRATQLAFAHGLRVRSPFCDPELTRWTFSLSSSLYLRGTCEKYILKRAAETWLPPEIVWRGKRGMGVPLTFWCFNQLWSDLGRWLNPADLRAEGLWRAHLPADILSGRLGGIQGRRMGEALWLLLMWRQWRLTVLGDASTGWALDHPFWLPRWFWQALRRG